MIVDEALKLTPDMMVLGGAGDRTHPRPPPDAGPEPEPQMETLPEPEPVPEPPPASAAAADEASGDVPLDAGPEPEAERETLPEPEPVPGPGPAWAAAADEASGDVPLDAGPEPEAEMATLPEPEPVPGPGPAWAAVAEEAAGDVPPDDPADLPARPQRAPPTLARATAQDVRPWRGAAFAAGGHLLVVVAALLLVTLHMPVAAPEQVMVSVVEQTAPPGNAAQTIPAPPAPAHHARARARAMPLPPPPAPSARLPLPMPHAPALAPAAAKMGVKAPPRLAGQVTVAATQPARVDADSTVIYSLTARELGEQGQVFLSVVVQPDGRPAAIRVVKSSGYATLDEDARLSAATWHFQPALKDGVPVSSVLLYWVRFQLQ